MTSYVNECDLRTIDTANGAIEYLWVDITDANHQDITTDPVSISLGAYDTPGAWHTADLIEQNGSVWQIRAGLLIGGTLTYPPGTYWAWSKVVDSPETIPKRSDNMQVRIT